MLTSSSFIPGILVSVAFAYEMNALTASVAFRVALLLCSEFSYAVTMFGLRSNGCSAGDVLYFVSRGAAGLNSGFTDSSKLPKLKFAREDFIFPKMTRETIPSLK